MYKQTKTENDISTDVDVFRSLQKEAVKGNYYSAVGNNLKTLEIPAQTPLDPSLTSFLSSPINSMSAPPLPPAVGWDISGSSSNQSMDIASESNSGPGRFSPMKYSPSRNSPTREQPRRPKPKRECKQESNTHLPVPTRGNMPCIPGLSPSSSPMNANPSKNKHILLPKLTPPVPEADTPAMKKLKLDLGLDQSNKGLRTRSPSADSEKGKLSEKERKRLAQKRYRDRKRRTEKERVDLLGQMEQEMRRLAPFKDLKAIEEHHESIGGTSGRSWSLVCTVPDMLILSTCGHAEALGYDPVGTRGMDYCRFDKVGGNAAINDMFRKAAEANQHMASGGIDAVRGYYAKVGCNPAVYEKKKVTRRGGVEWIWVQAIGRPISAPGVSPIIYQVVETDVTPAVNIAITMVVNGGFIPESVISTNRMKRSEQTHQRTTMDVAPATPSHISPVVSFKTQANPSSQPIKKNVRNQHTTPDFVKPPPTVAHSAMSSFQQSNVGMQMPVGSPSVQSGQMTFGPPPPPVQNGGAYVVQSHFVNGHSSQPNYSAELQRGAFPGGITMTHHLQADNMNGWAVGL